MCACGSNCSESGCGENCGTPIQYIVQTGPKGDKGESLVYYDFTSGGTVVANSYTQVAGSVYPIPANALQNGDYTKYVHELTNSGSIAVLRNAKLMLNDTDLFSTTTPDTLPPIAMLATYKRCYMEAEFLKTSNTTMYVTVYFRVYDSASIMLLETVYYMSNVDLSAISVDLSVSQLEISMYYKGDGTNGLTHLKTKALQYNQ